MDGDTPAVGSVNAETVETPTTTTVLPGSTVATPETTTVEPSPAAPIRPDPEELLADPEYQAELLKHPTIQQAIDKEARHRFESERGRVKAEARAEFDQLQQQLEQQRTLKAERERIEALDPYDLGVEEKERLAKLKEDEALQERMRPIQSKFQSDTHARLLHDTSSDMFTAIRDEAKAAGMSDTDIEEKMHPMLYNSLTEFTHGTIRTIAQAMAKELAKPLAKAEAKALFEEHLAARRENTGVPESLPAAEAGQGDDEFAADYADGKSNDTARQIKWMRDNGIPV